MGRHVPGGFAHYLRGLARTLRDDPRRDAELLDAFAAGDQSAFTALVVRHAPGVWSACRRVLGDKSAEDAEDAFQATFIALARQARVESPSSVAGWLARVARRVSLNVQTAGRRRDAAHRRLYATAVPRGAAPPDEEGRAAVREELAALPERLRVPLALYYLDGKTQAETGRLLGVTEQAASQRLRRGLDALRSRLALRGMTMTGAAVAAVLGDAPVAEAVPPGLVAAAAEAALEAAAGGPAVTAAARLAHEVLHASGGSRLGLAGLVLAVVAGAACGAVACLEPDRGAPPPEPPAAAGPAVPHGRADRFGDPLPDGAVVRIGTNRLRTAKYPGEASVALSPAGETIYSADGGDAVRVWDAATGRELRTVPGPQTCMSVAVSPDGRRLVAGGLSEVWAWEIGPDGDRLLWKEAPKGLGYRCVAFSPDGQTVACGGDNEHAIHLLTAGTGEPVLTLPGRGHKLVYSPDGKSLASWDNGVPPHEVCVWDVATGEKRRTVTCGADKTCRVTSFAFSADGGTLATASRDRAIRLWDLATGKARVLTAEANYNAFVAFEPDGRVLIEAGGRRIRFWDPATGKEARPSVDAPDLALNYLFNTCSLSADGRRLASATPSAIGAWDVRTGRPAGPTGVPTGCVVSVAFTPDGQSLGVNASTGDFLFVTQLYDARTGRRREELRTGGEGRDLATLSGPVVVTPRGEVVTSGGRLTLGRDSFKLDGLSLTWKPGAAAPAAETVVEGTGVGFLPAPALSPDGSLLATNRPGGVAVLERATGAVVTTIKMATATQIVFSPDGGTLACWEQTAEAASVSVWEARTGTRRGRWAASAGPLVQQPLAVSPGGRRVAIGTTLYDKDNGAVQVWDVAAGERVWEAALPVNPACTVEFSPDGRSLATGGVDGQVRVWEAGTGVERFHRAGHRAQVLALAFSPDGRRVASGSADTTALIWDTRPARVPAAAAALWDTLTGRDGAAAYGAVLALAEAPAVAVPLLRDRLTAPPPPAAQVKKWIADLESDEFAVREAAMRGLAREGSRVEAALRTAARTGISAEAATRIRALLQHMGPRAVDRLGITRGIEVLERAATPAARKLLRELAETPAEGLLGQEARAARRRLAEAPPAP